MNAEQYIQSGMLESFCLGALGADEQADVVQMLNLYPDVRAEFEAIEVAMEQLAFQFAITPKVEIKNKVLTGLFGYDLANLPLTGSSSNLDAWFKAVAHLIPDDKSADFFQHLLKQDDKVTQALVISRVNIPDETHDNLIESFYILEGSCKCMLDDKEYILNAGDFLEIPLHRHHDVVLLTPYVIAIRQQLALQAA